MAAFSSVARAGRLGLVGLLGTTALLAGCKGGGGGTGGFGFNYSSPFAPPTPESPSVLTTVSSFVPTSAVAALRSQATTLANSPRYAVQAVANWVIRLDSGRLVTISTDPMRNSGVAFAHAAGLSGFGQTVVVVDTHINENHEAFAGKPAGTVSLATANSFLSSDVGTNNHGTSVASIVGGQSASMIGVAPGASIVFGDFGSDTTATQATIAATNLNAVAMNNSWGFDSLPVGTNSFNALFSSSSGAAYLNALRTYAQQGVVVFAVSNRDTNTHSTIMDALPYVDPSLEAGWIAVGNAAPVMNGSGNVQSVTMLSSGCWEAARWCLLADGSFNHLATTQNSLGVVSNTDYDFGTGSSFAAPQVSGALALLGQAFPSLTPHQLRVRLLAAADNKFFAPDATVELTTGFNKGYSFQYGLGFLDIEAALQPIGPSQMSLADGSVQFTDQPLIQTGSAMGDAVAHSLSQIDVAVTDILDAPFLQSAQSLAAANAPAPLSRSLLARTLGTDLTSARTLPVSGLAEPFAAFNAPSWQVSSPGGDLGASVLMAGEDGFGLGLRRALTDGPTRLELGLKVARDSGAVMGFGGAGDAATSMASVELGLTQDLSGGGFFSIAGEMGVADLGSQAILSSVSSARFDSMRIQFGTNDALTRGDRLALGVALPMAVTGGQAQAILPVANALGSANFTPVGIDLSPSDRQVDISLSYQTPLSDHAELMAKIVHAENYGNRAGESDQAAVLALNFAF